LHIFEQKSVLDRICKNSRFVNGGFYMEILPEYLERAKELHQQYPVVDAHLDLAGELLLHVNNGEKNVLFRHYRDQLREGGFNLVLSSIYLENRHLPEMGLRTAFEQIGVLLEEIEHNQEFKLIKNKRDLDLTMENNQIGIILYLEGMDFVGTNYHLLRVLWELGVRGASLTWSRRNLLASGCCTASKREQIAGGLSPEGFEMLHKMEELGMFLDVSHLNDDGFEDILNAAKRPFIATHSNSRTVYFSYRNMTDKQIKNLARQGGIMGLNGCRYLVGNPNGENALEWMCRHVEYEVSLIGAEHVGYGFDFCDAYDNAKPRVSWIENHNDCLADHSQVPVLTAALLQRGMKEEDMKKIIGGNFIEYFRKMLPPSMF